LVAWQVRRLLVLLLKGALAWGYTTDLWTTSRSRAIPPSLADLIERLKRENPHRTDTTLLRELALSSDPNSPPVPASTLYRFLQQRGRPTCARCGSQAPDSQDP
jgi:hypothetical protein